MPSNKQALNRIAAAAAKNRFQFPFLFIFFTFAFRSPRPNLPEITHTVGLQSGCVPERVHRFALTSQKARVSYD